MRILADENFPGPLVETLRRRGHDVLWARIDCPGLQDRYILERAEAEGRILLTLDKDFWQLALQRKIPLKRAGVILFRASPAIPERLAPLVDLILLAAHSWTGHISIVTRDGVEMVPTGGQES